MHRVIIEKQNNVYAVRDIIGNKVCVPDYRLKEMIDSNKCMVVNKFVKFTRQSKLEQCKTLNIRSNIANLETLYNKYKILGYSVDVLENNQLLVITNGKGSGIVLSDGQLYIDNGKNMFHSFSHLEALDLSEIDLTAIRDAFCMFKGCSSLKTLNFGDESMTLVENMTGMFKGCESIEKLDLRCFKTTNVRNMANMFSDCFRLSNVNLSSFSTRNVISFAFMFNNCASLKKIKIANFRTTSLKDMDMMFNGCTSLETLDFSNLSTKSLFSEKFDKYDILRNTGNLKYIKINKCNSLYNIIKDTGLFIYDEDTKQFKRKDCQVI